MKKVVLSLCLSAIFGMAMAQEIKTYSVYDTNQNDDVSVSDIIEVVEKVKMNVDATSTQQYVTADLLSSLFSTILNKLNALEIRMSALEAKIGIETPDVPQQSSSFEIANKNMKVGDTFTQLVTSNSNGTVMYISSNPSVATVDANSGLVTAMTSGETIITAIIAATSTCNAMAASYTVVVDESNMLNGYEYVDLGLPSGTKWAKHNIGAESMLDCGDFFAWGDIKGYKSNHTFSLANDIWYKTETESYVDNDGFSVENTYEGYTKYVLECDKVHGFKGFFDDKSTLELADDAANIIWGQGWKIPTKENFDELLEQCSWTWTSLNGVSGYKVTSKVNSNYIFLPATKLSKNGKSLYQYYWSSTLNNGSSQYGSHAYRLGISKEEHTTYNRDFRYDGLTIRPVFVNFK